MLIHSETCHDWDTVLVIFLPDVHLIPMSIGSPVSVSDLFFRVYVVGNSLIENILHPYHSALPFLVQHSS